MDDRSFILGNHYTFTLVNLNLDIPKSMGGICFQSVIWMFQDKAF